MGKKSASTTRGSGGKTTGARPRRRKRQPVIAEPRTCPQKQKTKTAAKPAGKKTRQAKGGAGGKREPMPKEAAAARNKALAHDRDDAARERRGGRSYAGDNSPDYGLDDLLYRIASGRTLKGTSL